jgi:hypothetical protein
VVVLADVLDVIASSERVCPRPQKWSELFRLLPHTCPTSPAVPLILGGWWHSTPMQKRQRLREHVEWAATHGALDVVSNFINSLQESDWVHLNEAPSGRVDIDSYKE